MIKFLLLITLSINSLLADDEFVYIKDVYLKSYNYEYMGQYDEAIKVLTPLYEKYTNGYTLNLRFGHSGPGCKTMVI